MILVSEVDAKQPILRRREATGIIRPILWYLVTTAGSGIEGHFRIATAVATEQRGVPRREGDAQRSSTYVPSSGRGGRIRYGQLSKANELRIRVKAGQGL